MDRLTTCTAAADPVSLPTTVAEFMQLAAKVCAMPQPPPVNLTPDAMRVLGLPEYLAGQYRVGPFGELIPTDRPMRWGC